MVSCHSRCLCSGCSQRSRSRNPTSNVPIGQRWLHPHPQLPSTVAPETVRSPRYVVVRIFSRPEFNKYCKKCPKDRTSRPLGPCVSSYQRSSTSNLPMNFYHSKQHKRKLRERTTGTARTGTSRRSTDCKVNEEGLPLVALASP